MDSFDRGLCVFFGGAPPLMELFPCYKGMDCLAGDLGVYFARLSAHSAGVFITVRWEGVGVVEYLGDSQFLSHEA